MSDSASGGSPDHGSNDDNSAGNDGLGEQHPYEHADDGYYDRQHGQPGREGWLRLARAAKKMRPNGHDSPSSSSMSTTQRRPPPRSRDGDRRRTSSLPPDPRRTSSRRSSSGGRGGLLDDLGLHGLVGERWAGGVEAAIGAAAVELFRTRKEPWSLSGKGARVATAALAAAAIETTVDKRGAIGGSSNKLVVAESAVAGLLVNRVVSGPRKKARF